MKVMTSIYCCTCSLPITTTAGPHRCLLLPTFFSSRSFTQSLKLKVYPVVFKLVIARLAVAPLVFFMFFFPGCGNYRNTMRLGFFLAGCRMYILIRNKVLQLSVHFLLGYFNKLELRVGNGMGISLQTRRGNPLANTIFIFLR